jgi:hypothetical protein
MNRGGVGTKPQWTVSYANSVVPQALNNVQPASQGAVMAAACGAPIPTLFVPGAYTPVYPSLAPVIIAAAG